MVRAFLSSLLIAGVAHAAPESFDVVVYGGNAGGIAAAVQASRMGKRVVVIEPTTRIGGMATSGLGATDIGARSTIGGIAREFYGRIYTHYQQPGAWAHETRAEYVPKHPDNITENMKVHWFVEPKVAHQTFEALLAESKATLVLNDQLLLDGGVTKQGNRIVSIKTEGGREFAGRVFIDCSYEGDLMAKAGVAYTVGRE
ncbi:FAD-dependent oxidoreductase, partial [bacterium]